MDNKIKAIFKDKCPHCDKEIVIRLDVPAPTGEILDPKEAEEILKNVVDENDTSQTSQVE